MGKGAGIMYALAEWCGCKAGVASPLNGKALND